MNIVYLSIDLGFLSFCQVFYSFQITGFANLFSGYLSIFAVYPGNKRNVDERQVDVE
jgi:hypothetical protein